MLRYCIFVSRVHGSLNFVSKNPPLVTLTAIDHDKNQSKTSTHNEKERFEITDFEQTWS